MPYVDKTESKWILALLFYMFQSATITTEFLHIRVSYRLLCQIKNYTLLIIGTHFLVLSYISCYIMVENMHIKTVNCHLIFCFVYVRCDFCSMERYPKRQALSKHWHNGCVIVLSMTQGWLALKQRACVRVHMHVLMCRPFAFVNMRAHMRVSACACTCVYPQHRAAVKWVNALKGLLGSPARSLPAIMRMFSVFSSISAPGSLRRESLADARHVADVCYWSDIWK